jgi:hypothetical protein
LLATVTVVDLCHASTYYVSKTGSDANNGTSAATPWATLGAHVNGGTFAAGDVIYLKRGDTWNEQLIPPSAGGTGNPIQFDAYGSGAAPVITALAPIPFSSGSWTYISGSTWKATISTGVTAANTVNAVQFGKLYGTKKPYGSGCVTSIVGKYDWCLSWPFLYVYSPVGVNPVSTYASDGSISPVVAVTSGLAMISVVGRSWLTFQHMKIQTFDYMGVGVTGASDNLVFANMEVDGMVPYGTTPLGFYVNATNPENIQFINDDAYLNYDGFRFDGTATAITVTNCRGYANRDAGLKDNTGHATYSYSHFYGNNVAQFPTSDVVGGTAGSGNVGSTIAPEVTNFSTYPARFSFTVDDVGSSSNTEAYINALPAVFASHGTGSDKFNAAVVPSYSVDWASVNNWYAAGNEVDSHSWSHQYYTTNSSPGNSPPYPNAPALKMQYTGSGTAATMTVSGTTLTVNVTGAADGFSIDLSSSPYSQMGTSGTGGWGLAEYLTSKANYTIYVASDPCPNAPCVAGAPLVRPNTDTLNLAGTTGSSISISGQDIKTAPFVWVYDQTLLLADEMKSSQKAIEANVPGLTEALYVYPDGIEDPTAEADAIAAVYTAARGSLAMKDQTNQTLGANSLYSNGVNVQNITSLAAVQIHGWTQAQIQQKVGSLVFRAAAWGIPYAFFTHYNSRGDGTPDISNTELGYLLDAVTASGGTWMTNAALASAITAAPAQNLSGSTRYVQKPTGSAVDMTVAGANSPSVGHGTTTAYAVDLNGTNRSTLGTWDIGASSYLSQRYGKGAGSGNTYIGGWRSTANGTGYTVKAGGGGNYSSIQACASAISPGDTCTVYAGTYSEDVTVPAGSAGNYKTLTVNGSDVVTVQSFVLNSHTKLIGNCTVPAAINTCGFNIQNPASPGAASCVSTPQNATDIYIAQNVMYACANGIGNGSSTSGAAIYVPQGSSYIYIQGNTVSYPAATTSNPVLTGKGVDFGEPTGGVDNVLAENNDFSHYTLGIKFTSRHSIFRNNTFHDQIETEGSSNKHTDIFFSEQPSNVQYNVIEGNLERNAVGPNAKGVLAQGDYPCSGCTNLIARFDTTSRIGSGVSSNYPTWPHIVQYNNTHVDLNMEGSTSGQDTDYNDGGLTNAAILNNLYSYNTPSAWSNWNSGSCGSSCNAGHNLYWCTGAGCSAPYNHIYGGSGGSWTADAGNLHADPLFVNYVSPGNPLNDYHLQASSPARNAGTHLTTVNGTVSNSTLLVVSDASYFQDGYGLSNAYSPVQGDCISVTTISKHVCITAVNYATNTLTLAAPISAGNGDPVWIYSLSDGTVVLTDSTGPDLGAMPYSTTGASVALPQNWVNSLEWVGTTTNTINFPSTGTGGAWACGATNYGPYTAGSQASLQQAVNDAESCRTANSSGTKIVIPAGSSYSGSTQALTLPQTAGDTSTNFIVLTSSTAPTTGQTLCSHGIQDNVAASTQPGIRNLGCNGSSLSYQLGTTVTSIPSGQFTLANGTATNTSAYNDLAKLFTLQCTSGSCSAINTASWDTNNVGPHHFAIIGAEMLPQPGLASPNAPVAIGQSTETMLSQIPSHIHLSYDYIHGDWTDAPVTGGAATGGPTGANSLPNGVAFRACINCSINYSYLDRMIRPGGEGHGIYMGLAQQIKIDHNWVEGASIGAFSGGYSTNLAIPNFVDAQDVEDRGNRYTYPYSWILAYQAGFCVNGLTCSGNGYVRKNSHETKVANRYLYDGNINENVDGSGGQSGIAISWKTDNGGGANYWIVNQDVTMTNTVMRNLCQGASWGFRSVTSSGNGGGVTLPTQNALLGNNLSYNVSTANPGCSGVSNFGFRVNNNDGNTWAASAVRDATGSIATLTLTSVAGGTQSDMNAGDPVNVTGCTDSSFNTSTTGLTPALTGTTPTSLTVRYANSGTANASTSGCTFNNLQGWPRNLIYTHNSDFVNDGTNATSPMVTANASPLPLSRNMQFINSIFVGGGLNSTFGEGTRTQTKAFDGTSEIFNNDLFAGRDALVTCPGHSSPGAGGMAACYTEYSAGSVASTPQTLYGTPASSCSGNDPTAGNCVGIIGAMGQSSFPAVLNDWHQYRLCHAGDAGCSNKASLYSAGQSYQGSDGTDLGVNVSAIDAAETATKYVCQSACGSGPSSD